MPKRCLLGGCSNSNQSGATMHLRPKDKSVARKWTNFVRPTQTRVFLFGSTPYSVLCCEHFPADSYSNSQLERKLGVKPKLKSDAVPVFQADRSISYTRKPATACTAVQCNLLDAPALSRLSEVDEDSGEESEESEEDDQNETEDPVYHPNEKDLQEEEPIIRFVQNINTHAVSMKMSN
ncbi:uncharacterized protein LOC135480397 [Liolophura sinensis]|uniref:uncharacterized protein LOC135480397 n=1 Tax=Liolophura sinensis TaxID=3198878 RepID=UPI0031597F25